MCWSPRILVLTFEDSCETRTASIKAIYVPLERARATRSPAAPRLLLTSTHISFDASSTRRALLLSWPWLTSSSALDGAG